MITANKTADTRDIKQMICGYCASLSYENNGKCQSCEYNPDYRDNFELSTSAETMIREGVFTKYGEVLMVSRLNANRLDRSKAIFDNLDTVDSGTESDPVGDTDSRDSD